MYSKNIEDYVEAIFDINLKNGYVRTKDISRELNVSAPSVTEMLGKLKDMGLVNYKKYRGVTLTKKGENVGKSIHDKHKIIRNFLKIIMVSDKVAEEDACRIEHAINPETAEQLTKFVKFVDMAPKNTKWIEHFKKFCKTGDMCAIQVAKSYTNKRCC